MRYDIYKKVAAMAVSGLLLLPSLLSCSDEQGGGPELPEEPQLCKVIISLQSPTGMRPATRAEDKNPGEDWKEEAERYEREIKDWVVVAYDEDGGFAGLVSNQAGGSGQENDTNNDNKITTGLELPFGKYTFFAFANWNSLDAIGTLEGGNIADKKDNLIEYLKTLSVTEVEDLAAQVGNIDTKFNVADGKKPIPMSSYGHEENLKSDEQQVKIPLIRMIAKVQVSFENQLSDNVTITAVKVGDFQNERPVFLAPWGNDYYLEFKDGFNKDDHRGPSFPDKEPSVSTDKEYSFTLPTEGLIIAKETATKASPLSCYVNESMASSTNHPNNMAVTITRQMKGDNNGTKEIVSNTDFAFVRRNDLLQIPVLLSNYSTTLEFGEVRLPIGVYPKAYEFGIEDGVQVLTPITYHVKSTGQLEVKYTLKDVLDAGKAWSIRYAPENPISGKKYSSIKVISNPDLLIDPQLHAVLEQGASICLKPSAENGQGSFTLCTQELGKTGNAQILLTLIVEYGDADNKRDIEIPYTINITNAPKAETPGA